MVMFTSSDEVCTPSAVAINLKVNLESSCTSGTRKLVCFAFCCPSDTLTSPPIYLHSYDN